MAEVEYSNDLDPAFLSGRIKELTAKQLRELERWAKAEILEQAKLVMGGLPKDLQTTFFANTSNVIHSITFLSDSWLAFFAYHPHGVAKLLSESIGEPFDKLSERVTAANYEQISTLIGRRNGWFTEPELAENPTKPTRAAEEPPGGGA